MPEQKNTGFSYNIPDGFSADAMRDEMLKGKADAALLELMGEALDLYSFMGTLPDALIASQKREAKRLAKFSGEKSPRIEALKASMEQAAQLDTTVRWGRARFDRAVASAIEPNEVFHGFVSGAGLQMQKGYTVRLMGADGKPRQSAFTEADGYFTMTLKARDKTSAYRTNDETRTVLLGELFKVFGMRGSSATASSKAGAATAVNDAPQDTAATEKDLASVEILDPNGRVVQQDPIPVDVNGGTVYREYLVGSKPGDVVTKRYVGNTASREIHDTQNLKKQCNFDAIRPNHKVEFDSTTAAEKAGYDYCAHCFDRKMSKR
ncbi:hypothetical protein HLB44_32590 [Aquincola sp. S2]|uniref:Uncharacterized protein n=1 Tax=Pseudaquabacterium terrae TaxID=2732868 RepID=A0ABX2ETA9_9BURK|nr:hypothetical protein [Aquabacterium terrae]NRF71737.1 hypothetical protein [Aquabacterium terrae]